MRILGRRGLGAVRGLSLFAAIALAGCAGRSNGDLIAIAADAPGASKVEMLVATTREATAEPPGAMFNGERARGLVFADIAVSIPPDSVRKIGEIQWPSSPPGDPSRDFVTLRADRLDLKEATARFDQRLPAGGRHVLIFVHGYNTRFDEAVYRFAQIIHDSDAPVVPVLFTWPSRGKLLDYAYDRDSATYSRDALEVVLENLAKDPKVASISILAHSMGNFLAVESLRQMAIRDGAISPKIRDIMLASPDIDVDVFRRQIAEIEKNDKTPPVTLFVSQDDRALSVSRILAGNEPRLGAIDPTVEPYHSILEQAHIHVVDLTKLGSDDSMNHSKFTESEVVKAIGQRLAAGQALSPGRASLGEQVGVVALGVTNTVGKAATLAVSAPLAVVDPQTRDTLEDQAADLAPRAPVQPSQ
jgi:esterase/lipase superfamily enzyme